MPFVYLLRFGMTTDVPKRLAQHQAGQASQYTCVHLPMTRSWTRQGHSWHPTLKEEPRIKALTQAQKEVLVKAEQKPDPKTS